MPTQQSQNLGIQETQPPTLTPQKSSSHTLLFIAGLALFVTGLGGGLLLSKYVLPTNSKNASEMPRVDIPTPTTDPTANWKTYTNDQFKFRFSYPPSWNVEETGKESLKLYPPRQSGVIYKIAPFELRVSIFSKVSLQQSGAELTRDIVLPYEKILEQKTINGLPVTVSEFTTEKGYKNLVASIIFPEIEIRITTYPISSSYEDIFDQILSTFKFLDQATISNSCTTDTDCGVNICDCKADLNSKIKSEDKICTRYCLGTPKCINSTCQLVN